MPVGGTGGGSVPPYDTWAPPKKSHSHEADRRSPPKPTVSCLCFLSPTMLPRRFWPLLLAVLLLVVPLTGCVSDRDGTTDRKAFERFEMEQLRVVRIPEGEAPRIPFDPAVEHGDTVMVAAQSVGPFNEGPDGKRHAGMQLTVYDASGDRVHRSGSNVSFDPKLMPSFRQPWQVGQASPGEYRLEMRVIDRVVDEQVKRVWANATLTVREQVDSSRETFGANGWGFLLKQGDQDRFNEAGVYKDPGPIVFSLVEVGPFEPGEDGNHQPEAEVVVTDASGERAVRRTMTFDGQRAADGVFPILKVGFSLAKDADPGRYTLDVTMRDTVSGAEFDVTRAFALRPGLS